MTLLERSTDPFELVAKALDRPRGTLSSESAMYRDHGWDSFGHASIISAIEEALGVRISNEDTLSLTTMMAICDFFKRQCATKRD